MGRRRSRPRHRLRGRCGPGRLSAAADICACLRWPTNRETSASWLRCLAAGRPTIVTDLAHLATCRRSIRAAGGCSTPPHGQAQAPTGGGQHGHARRTTFPRARTRTARDRRGSAGNTGAGCTGMVGATPPPRRHGRRLSTSHPNGQPITSSIDRPARALARRRVGSRTRAGAATRYRRSAQRHPALTVPELPSFSRGRLVVSLMLAPALAIGAYRSHWCDRTCGRPVQESRSRAGQSLPAWASRNRCRACVRLT